MIIELWRWMDHHWAAVAMLVTLLSLVIFVVLVMAKYVRLCLNIFVDTPPPLSMGPLDVQRLTGEIVRFRSFGGTSLGGMHLRCPNELSYKGTVVFCHEFGSDMFGCARYASPLIEAGFDVFTFDFRSHGDSSSGTGKYRPLQWPSDKELEDVLGASAYMESVLEAQGRDTRLGVFGISRGAGAGLLAAASDPNIAAIVCDGAFSTDTTLISYMKRWAHIFARVKLVYENHPEIFWKLLVWLLMKFAQPRLGCRYPSVRRALKEMQPRPVFFIHGRRDSYIRQAQSELLYNEAPLPKYLWLVDQAKHNQSVIVEPEHYAGRTIAFFRKYLANEQVDENEITCKSDVEVA